MTENVRNFLVGITSIVALLGISYLLFQFGELESLVHPRYRVRLNTDNAAGLRPGSPVEFNGVPVGVVNSVWVQNDPQWPVTAELLIDEDTRLPATVMPTAVSPLIGGGSRLLLQSAPAAEGQSIQYLSTRGDAQISGKIGGGAMFDQLTAALDERMKPLLEGLDSFNRLSEKYIELGDNLNSMLQPQSTEAVAAGESPNLRTAVTKLNSALDDVRESLALAKQWLGDEQIRNDAKAAVEKAATLIDKASTAVDRYAQLADTLQTDARDVRNRLLPVIDNLSTTLEDVRRLTKMAGEGKGTLAQFLNNPDLYNSLSDAAVRLERTLVEAQLLMQKIKAEGLPVKF